MNPTDIPLGLPVKAEKLADDEKFLTKHFGAAWKEHHELKRYKSLLDDAVLIERQADEPECDCFKRQELVVDEPDRGKPTTMNFLFIILFSFLKNYYIETV